MAESSYIKALRGSIRSLRARLIGCVSLLAGMLIASMVLAAGNACRIEEYKQMVASSQAETQAAQEDAELWRQTAELYKAEAQTIAQTKAKEAQLVGAEYVGEFMATAYCTEKYEHICGEGHGITKSGQPVQAGVTVAADPTVLPLGTVIYIEGVGIRIVQDTGGAIKGNRIDVAIDTHENALNWTGYGTHAVYILSTPEEVDA
jgi:3D (Asp-Asp-Asp) domain-containing protein